METINFIQAKIKKIKLRIKECEEEIKLLDDPDKIKQNRTAEDEYFLIFHTQGLIFEKERLQEKAKYYIQIIKELKAFEAIKRNMDVMEEGALMAFCVYENCTTQAKDVKTIRKAL